MAADDVADFLGLDREIKALADRVAEIHGKDALTEALKRATAQSPV
jgi:hypothetical protein